MDVLFERCELREATLTRRQASSAWSCAAAAARGYSAQKALRGARMPWSDVLANAPLLAAGLGIEKCRLAMPRFLVAKRRDRPGAG